MAGETELSALFKTMEPVLDADTYVFATLAKGSVPADVTAHMLFEEIEGTTLILRLAEATQHAIAYEFPCRMITLNVHSSLEAVGFIAHIATQLAKAKMGVNPVSGYFHDHLFVPEGREVEAMEILKTITQNA